ncbi:hypothetical protein [Gordonia sp. HS-NH1]|uniref:hypothetical protein n=1 Tax=Gordonia sp. HS-NH1 TaxID=1435068 RepID=UPI0006E3E04D|nr:hypothetical protein [Gordonia sp. HS-NH1]
MNETGATRVELARERVDTAVRRARTARIAAAPALRWRAIRRTRLLRRTLVAAALAVLVLVAVAGVLSWQIRGQHEVTELTNDVLASARGAVTVMLTADPADPDGYVTAVAEVSTGAQRERIEAARDALVAEVGGQTGSSVGQVVSAGLVTDPTSDEIGADVDVLVVADATNPALLGESGDGSGVDTTGERVTALVTMTLTEDGWKIAQARRP